MVFLPCSFNKREALEGTVEEGRMAVLGTHCKGVLLPFRPLRAEAIRIAPWSFPHLHGFLKNLYNEIGF